MDLAFGTHVREHYYTIGRLAGIETDAGTHAVRCILVSADGTPDVVVEKRPLAAVPADHFSGDIELHAFSSVPAAAGGERVMLLTDKTRLMSGGKEIGHLSGVEIDPSTGQIVAVVGKHHWWTRQLHLMAADLDFSVPGELRVRDGQTVPAH